MGCFTTYNDKQFICESYVSFKNTNKWWRLQIAYDNKKWQTQRVKLFLFGHTMKTTKQNDKNLDKTEGLWIGKLKHCKDKVGGIKWTDKPTKTLGIYFGHDKEDCEKFNWENKIEKMNNL